MSIILCSFILINRISLLEVGIRFHNGDHCHHHHLFWKCSFFHTKLGLEVCSKSNSSTHSWVLSKLLRSSFIELSPKQCTSLTPSTTPPPKPSVSPIYTWTNTPPWHLALTQPHSTTLPEQNHYPNTSWRGNQQHTPIYLKYHYTFYEPNLVSEIVLENE